MKMIEKSELEELFSYAVEMRRELHRYPEIGFDLERTVALVKRELERSGIVYTDRYGRSSVVADILPTASEGERSSCDRVMIALRADMDALPIEEKNTLPFRSQIAGRMHACGHDAHTAVLLAVARYLKRHEDELCRPVRLIFQPSEESAESGAKMMVENGVMDGVGIVAATHVENDLDSGKIGICKGNYMAACIPAKIRFIGKSAHAALPREGIDAIAMAVDFYTEMKKEVERLSAGEKYIWSVGKFTGGTAHNVISDLCELDISFRFYSYEFATRVEDSVKKACKNIEEKYGGKCEIRFDMSTGAVINDPEIATEFSSSLIKEGIPVEGLEQRMSSEDFGWYLTKAPGLIFRFGTRNEKLGCTSLVHTDSFMIDEEGMRFAIRAFSVFVDRF